MAKFKVGDFVKHDHTDRIGRIMCVDYVKKDVTFNVVNFGNDITETYRDDVLSLFVSNFVGLKDHRKTETVVTVSKYPALMEFISDNGSQTVVLVAGFNKTSKHHLCGTVVKTNNKFHNHNIGEYSAYWRSDVLKPYKGDIVLTNGE